MLAPATVSLQCGNIVDCLRGKEFLWINIDSIAAVLLFTNSLLVNGGTAMVSKLTLSFYMLCRLANWLKYVDNDMKILLQNYWREILSTASITFFRNEWSLQIMEGQRFCGVEDPPRGEVVFFSAFKYFITVFFSCSGCPSCRSKFRKCPMRCTLKTKRRGWLSSLKSLLTSTFQRPTQTIQRRWVLKTWL